MTCLSTAPMAKKMRSRFALMADTAGVATHVVEDGIVLQSSGGDATVIVTKVEDLSSIALGKDCAGMSTRTTQKYRRLRFLCGVELRPGRNGRSAPGIMRLCPHVDTQSALNLNESSLA